MLCCRGPAMQHRSSMVSMQSRHGCLCCHSTAHRPSCSMLSTSCHAQSLVNTLCSKLKPALHASARGAAAWQQVVPCRSGSQPAQHLSTSPVLKNRPLVRMASSTLGTHAASSSQSHVSTSSHSNGNKPTNAGPNSSNSNTQNVNGRNASNASINGSSSVATRNENSASSDTPPKPINPEELHELHVTGRLPMPATLDPAKAKQQLERLHEQVMELGAVLPSHYKGPGYFRGVCPFCEGGSNSEASFGLWILEDCSAAIYNCFRATCGESGRIAAVQLPAKRVKPVGLTSDPDPGLRTKLEEFFWRRGISPATLDKCGVTSVMADVMVPDLGSSTAGNCSSSTGSSGSSDGSSKKPHGSHLLRHCAAIPYRGVGTSQIGNMTFIDLDALQLIEDTEVAWTGVPSFLRPPRVASTGNVSSTSQLAAGATAPSGASANESTMQAAGSTSQASENGNAGPAAGSVPQLPLAPSFTGLREARAKAVWQQPGETRMLWGLSDALPHLPDTATAASGPSRHAKLLGSVPVGKGGPQGRGQGVGNGKARQQQQQQQGPEEIIIVEDELDRMSLIEAGFAPSRVLSLPPGTRSQWTNLQLKRAQPQTGLTAPNPRPMTLVHATWGQGQDRQQDVLDELLPKEVLEKVFGQNCRKITLALSNLKSTSAAEAPSASEGGGKTGKGKTGKPKFEEEDERKRQEMKSLEQGFGKELARRLGSWRVWQVKWPSVRDELPPSSPHSPLHAVHTPTPPAPDPSNPNLFPQERARYEAAAVSAQAMQLPKEEEPQDTQRPSSAVVVLHGRVLRQSANEMLLADGPQALLDQVMTATEEWPEEGLYEMKKFVEDVWEEFSGPRTYSTPVSTGWEGMDMFYKPVAGELTVVTGIPNSGKSEWLDALCMNLAAHHGWRFAVCSFEKSPKDHARQLLEKYTGMPFFDTVDGVRVDNRMTREDVLDGYEFIKEHFVIIRHDAIESPGSQARPQDGSSNLATSKAQTARNMLWDQAELYQLAASSQASTYRVRIGGGPTIDWVLEKAKAAVQTHGIKGLVIDPYNELDKSDMKDDNETQYVSAMLGKVKRFAQSHQVHVWLVAHPRILLDWGGQPPSMYDISGSAHFINKADAGVVVHRWGEDWAAALGLEDHAVTIIVEKIRNKMAGTKGAHLLLYDRASGLYDDPSEEMALSFRSKFENKRQHNPQQGKKGKGRGNSQGQSGSRSYR